MPKGELRISRHACFGSNAQEVMTAIGHVLASLAARGFEVPADASVQVRASGFGYAATLMLPERLHEGDFFVLRRAVRRSSGILPRVDEADFDEARLQDQPIQDRGRDDAPSRRLRSQGA